MKRRIVAVLGLLLVAAAVAAPPRAVRAQATLPATPGAAAGIGSDDLAVSAREAFRLKDKAQLAALRQAAVAQNHPLASWVDYWEFGNRLAEMQQGDFDAFAERWRGTYVEDRLRNDWLLELGRRRDWANLRAEFPRFRMNDDREVTCYAVLAQHLEGLQDVRNAARQAWLAQRDSDEGCQLLGATLFEQKIFGADDIGAALRLAAEQNRGRLARERAALFDAALAAQVDALFKDPAKLLREKRGARAEIGHMPTVLALWRLAATDPDQAAAHLEQNESFRMPPLELARAWGGVARQAALKQHAKAADYARRAFAALDKAAPRNRAAAPAESVAPGSSDAATATAAATTPAAGATPAAAPVTGSTTVLTTSPTATPVASPAAAPAPGARAPEPVFSDETLGWMARAALRTPANDRHRWTLLTRAVDEMSATEQRDATWVYWRARAIRAGAAPGPEGEGARGLARLTLESIAGPLGFYQQLAQEDLGRRVALPPPPVPLVESERDPVRQHAGLRRSLRLMSLGLRGEGVREWNYSLRGMNDRELLASAAIACEREVWDRCINTSERTRDVADIAQRYPLPFRDAVLARTAESGVDAAYVYGLIRQESRFILDARSSVGASGLMQLMPATARWTARRAGLVEWKPEMVTDRDINLMLGTTYLKLVLDEFGGAQAMGAAAYNAGPSRPRRWREGGTVEAAAWIEGIPFNETRDYVKKVLSNAVIYAARLQAQGAVGGGAVAGAGGAAGAPAPVGPVSLKARLGGPIGPRDPAAPAENRELP
jgi:soluble lytic murein transglycosylase